MVILSVGESRPKKFKLGAWLIRLVEQTDHSHSFISWHLKDAVDVRKVAQASGGGGNLIINEQFRRTNHVVRIFQYKIEDDKLPALEKWVWENLKPYGYKSLVGLFWMRIMTAYYRITGSDKKAVNPFKDGDYSQICVEMTARALLQIGIVLDGDVEDYGLREMHSINYLNYIDNKCDLASDSLLNAINYKYEG